MSKTVRNALKMGELGELSLVDGGANQHANAVIFKRASPKASGETTKRKTFMDLFKRFLNAVAPPAQIEKEAQSYAATRAVSELWTRVYALQDSIASIFASEESDAATRQKQLDVTLSQFRDDMQALNVDDSAFTSLADDGDPKVTKTVPTPPPVVADPHAGDSGADDEPSEGIMKTVPKTFTDIAKANEHIVTLTTERDAAVEKVETLEAVADPLAAITKGMAPAAVAFMKAQQAEVEKLREGQARVVLVEKAKTLLGNAGEKDDVEKLATVLKSVTGNADAEAFLTDVFTKYNEMLSMVDGLELGGTGGEDDAEGSAALEAATLEVMKINPKFSKAQAQARVLEINPDLYNETELSEPVRG